MDIGQCICDLLINFPVFHLHSLRLPRENGQTEFKKSHFLFNEPYFLYLRDIHTTRRYAPIGADMRVSIVIELTEINDAIHTAGGSA